MHTTVLDPGKPDNKMRPAPESRISDRAILTAIARRAMTERGLEPDFPHDALEELSAIPGPGVAGERVRDLRDRLWASIDNDDSRDLDQLTVGESVDNGKIRILVAIADVDALVGKGSAIDGHAAHNTTSVYTPAVIFPMLPTALSTNLTSLNENQDRLAMVIDMEFTTEGLLANSDHYRAQVRNRAKLAYSSVGTWLAGEGPMPAEMLKVLGLDANLRLQDNLAQRLASLRQKHGALSLETVEPKTVFTGDSVSKLEPNWKNRATQLIEEFMITANKATATYLGARNFPSIQRVLRSPRRWERITQLAADLGEVLPSSPDAVALEGFLAKQLLANPEKFGDLSLAVIKLIGRGEYALVPPGGEPLGHFALAVRNYTHSTAPNRRFPDLIMQRLLKAATAGGPLPYTLTELTEYAQRCTEREDDATKVERRMQKSAAALLLSGRIGESFDAIVTGASEKGTWVRILQPPTEGRLTTGFEGLDVGDRVPVTLLRTDVEHGFIDFAHHPTTARTAPIL